MNCVRYRNTKQKNRWNYFQLLKQYGYYLVCVYKCFSSTVWWLIQPFNSFEIISLANPKTSTSRLNWSICSIHFSCPHPFACCIECMHIELNWGFPGDSHRFMWISPLQPHSIKPQAHPYQIEYRRHLYAAFSFPFIAVDKSYRKLLMFVNRSAQSNNGEYTRKQPTSSITNLEWIQFIGIESFRLCVCVCECLSAWE